MSDLYNRIEALCKSKGISIGKMCGELVISRSNLTELKKERIKTLKADNLTKIASYFGVTVGFLLGMEPKTGSADNDGAREISDEEIMFALLDGDADEITDEMFNEVKWFAKAVRDKKRRENGKT